MTYTSSFWLGLTPAGHLRFYPKGGSGNYVQSAGAISTTRWTHIAATYRDGRRASMSTANLDSETSVISGPVGDNGRDFLCGSRQ